MGTRSSVVIIENGRVLMVRQYYKGEEIWTSAWGSIEENETPIEAAIREMKEETNCEVEIIKLLIEIYNEKIIGQYFCYLGRIIGGELRLGKDPELADQEQELKEISWKPIEEVSDIDEVKRILKFIWVFEEAGTTT